MLASGLQAVTVEDICTQAVVSPRTFFNYFPSKAMAALGLPELTITDEHRAAFLAPSDENVVRRLCRLVAEVIGTTSGYTDARIAIHELVIVRPEIKPELFRWLSEFRAQLGQIATARLPKPRAYGAVALVITALAELIEEDRPVEDDDLAERLWRGVLAMCALVTDGEPRAGA